MCTNSLIQSPLKSTEKNSLGLDQTLCMGASFIFEPVHYSLHYRHEKDIMYYSLFFLLAPFLMYLNNLFCSNKHISTLYLKICESMRIFKPEDCLNKERAEKKGKHQENNGLSPSWRQEPGTVKRWSPQLLKILLTNVFHCEINQILFLFEAGVHFLSLDKHLKVPDSSVG